MTAETRALAGAEEESRPVPALNPDDLRDVVEHIALNHEDFADSYALAARLLPAAAPEQWDEYCGHVEAIWDLKQGDDPGQWCDVDPRTTSESYRRDWAIHDQADKRDELFQRMTGGTA